LQKEVQMIEIKKRDELSIKAKQEASMTEKQTLLEKLGHNDL